MFLQVRVKHFDLRKILQKSLLAYIDRHDFLQCSRSALLDQDPEKSDPDPDLGKNEPDPLHWFL